MATWEGRSRGSLAGYKFLIFILKNFGRIPVYVVLVWVCFYYYLFSFRLFRSGYKYFRHIQRFSVIGSLWGIYRNYYSLAVSLVDKVAMYALEKPGFTSAFDGEINLKEFSNTGKGGVLLSGHLGNWELAGHFLHKYPLKVYMVYLDAENRGIKELLEKTMTKKKQNVEIINISGSMEHLFRMKEVLEMGHCICMHADRYMEGNKTVTYNFLGRPVKFATGPFQVAALYQAPISFIFGFKINRNHYQFYGIKPIRQEEGESKNDFIERAMKYYIHHMEIMVKRYPYQWYNFYDYWKP